MRARFRGPCVTLAGAVGASAQSPGGMSTQKETSLAASIKEKAVSGDVAAQRRLAAIYEQGFGVPQDYVQEAFWYRKAAEQGDADSQNNLGGLYEAGQGVRQSFTEAAFWYRKAAIQGNSTAHYNLGLLYSNGHGASRSNVEAYFWLDVAAATIKGKEPPAAAVRDIVAAKLSPTELSEAQERAAKWFVVEHPAPPCLQVNDQSRTCYRTEQEMERVINSKKERP